MFVLQRAQRGTERGSNTEKCLSAPIPSNIGAGWRSNAGGMGDAVACLNKMCDWSSQLQKTPNKSLIHVQYVPCRSRCLLKWPANLKSVQGAANRAEHFAGPFQWMFEENSQILKPAGERSQFNRGQNTVNYFSSTSGDRKIFTEY